MAFPWRYVDSMAIPWSPSQLECVNAAIGAHPAESGRCAELARQVAPVARELDPETHGLLVTPRPGMGRFVVPLAGHGRWYHHVTTAVNAHCVDALTGSSGTGMGSYLVAHWLHAEALRLAPVDLEEPWL